MLLNLCTFEDNTNFRHYAMLIFLAAEKMENAGKFGCSLGFGNL